MIKTAKWGPPYLPPEGCPSKEAFALLFKRVLSVRGLSMKRAAEITGLSYQTIKNYCAGKARPSENAVQILIDELGVDPGELLGRDYVIAAQRQAEDDKLRNELLTILGTMEAWELESFIKVMRDIRTNFLPQWVGMYVDKRSGEKDDFLLWFLNKSEEEQEEIMTQAYAEHG